MKNILCLALLVSAVLAAPQPHIAARGDDSDDNCSITWVTVYADSATSTPSTQPTASAGGSGTNDENSAAGSTGSNGSSGGSNSANTNTTTGNNMQSSSNATAAATGDTSSALNLPNLPNGEAPLPINGDHISAPDDNTPVPSNANVYSPAEAGIFDCNDFANWMKTLREGSPASKFMKVKAGTYRYKPGPVMAEGTDANTVQGENIVIYLMKGGWTLDLRGVTFYIDITPENHLQRPAAMIYVLQSDDFTIIGGTVWVDQGEPFTQAKCTSIDSGSNVATFQVDKGYNVSAWASAGARNQRCVSTKDSQTYTLGDCNFWKVDTYDFSKLESQGTFTARIIGPEANLFEGIYITMQVGPNSVIAISTEDNTGLNVKSFTSNANFMSIGLNGLVAPKFENVYQVNPAPRPGFAPRVMGPALSWGNIGGFIYNGPDQQAAQFTDSYWQYLAGPKDLQVGGDGSKPPGF